MSQSVALINVDDLSASTRQELELWGYNLVQTREAEIYEPVKTASPTVIVEMQRAAAIRAYLLAEADKAIKDAVFRAREEKLSWRTIGNALGITGEAARLRLLTANPNSPRFAGLEGGDGYRDQN